MKKIVSTLALAAFFIAVSAQTSVVPYLSNDVMPEGLIYHLPRTTIKIKATAECTISKPGPFFRYAERFFAQKDIVVEETVNWKLKDVKLIPVSEPNPNAVYEVKIDKKNIGVSNFLSLTDKGLLKGVNLKEYGKIVKRKCAAKHECRVEVKDIDFNMNVLGEEALVANSIPKMAELAAKQVYRLRESRLALLNGEVDAMPSGDAMSQVLAAMDKTEKELLELFFGKSVSYTETRVFTHVPEDDASKLIVFRISALEGLVDSDNVMGEPIYMSLKGKYPVAPAAPLKAPKMLGFAYAVPGTADIEIFDKDITYTSGSFKMPQFGYTLHLSSTITDNPNVSIKYNAATGEIMSIGK